MLNSIRQLALLTALAAAGAAHGVEIDVTLLGEIDRTGSQLEVLQAIDVGGTWHYDFGIYDTGASVVTVSEAFQQFAGVPIKCFGCAGASAIGGPLFGDVSQPVTVRSDGVANTFFNFDINTLDFSFGYINPSAAVQVPNVQLFVGTSESSLLPTITGTPVHISGTAAHIDMNGYSIDFGDIFPGFGLDGIVISQPNVSFVAPTTTLGPGGGFVTAPVRIPLELLGVDNSASPGDNITALPNPVQTSIHLENLVGSTNNSSSGKTFLFDTGAQLSIISTAIAIELGLDLGSPEFTIEVQGAGGVEPDPLQGYVIDTLQLPVDDNGDGVIDGHVTLHDVPVFVYDIQTGLNEPALDGILGMNLWNTAEEMLYNPFDPNGPSLTISFNTDPDRGLGDLEDIFGDLDPVLASLFGSLGDLFPAFAGAIGTGPIYLPTFGPPPAPQSSAAEVPEPSTWLLLAGGGTLLAWRVRGRRRAAQAVVALSCVFAAASATSAAVIDTRRVATGLTNPVFVAQAPGDSQRLFIVGQAGGIRILDLATGTIDPTRFITIDNTLPTGFTSGGERGLLGLAFDPNYATNGHFYVNYTGTDGAIFVRRFTALGDPATSGVADVSSGRTIITIPHPGQTNHNGGWLGFGPDNKLYIATGDGGGSNDPNNNALDITSNLLGKMLRIDPSADGFGDLNDNKNYLIPSDNPFVGQSGDDEIWAFGLRNPFRNSFDRATGDLYIADVGQNAREEVNFQPASSDGGENYGWRAREGLIQNPTTGVGGPKPPGAIDPFHDYNHNSGDFGGFSVTGGYVYRGDILNLQGKYFFGDYVTQRIWSAPAQTTVGATPLDEANGDITDWTNIFRNAVGGGTIGGISSFGEDNLGNLYVVDYGTPGGSVADGEIYRIFSDEFDAVAAGANVSVTVGDGAGNQFRTVGLFASVTTGGEFSSQYQAFDLADLDPDFAASIDFDLASEPVQWWEVAFRGAFAGPVELTFTYDDDHLVIPEEELNIWHRLTSGEWELATLLALDTVANTIRIQTNSFSPFLLGGEPAPVVNEPAAVPEPGMGVLLIAGLGFLGARRKFGK